MFIFRSGADNPKWPNVSRINLSYGSKFPKIFQSMINDIFRDSVHVLSSRCADKIVDILFFIKSTFSMENASATKLDLAVLYDHVQPKVLI